MVDCEGDVNTVIEKWAPGSVQRERSLLGCAQGADMEVYHDSVLRSAVWLPGEEQNHLVSSPLMLSVAAVAWEQTIHRLVHLNLWVFPDPNRWLWCCVSLLPWSHWVLQEPNWDGI